MQAEYNPFGDIMPTLTYFTKVLQKHQKVLVPPEKPPRIPFRIMGVSLVYGGSLLRGAGEADGGVPH